MEYELMLRSRPVAGESVQAKHEAFRAALTGLEGAWSGGAADWPAVPDPATREMVEVRLSGRFGRGIRGYVSYQNRKYIPDDSMYDDYFVLEFDPARIDYKRLVEDYFARYVGAFHPYLGYVADQDFLDHDFDSTRDLNDRHSIYRIYPVSFFDEQLCREALGLAPEQVVERLAGVAEEVRVVHGGVLILGSTTPLPFEAALALSDRLTQQLRP